ncbi:IS110 family transposase [Desulfosediminicola ganghwensis]|uniref:IS110 family transposase n=1 Tax=Desulfosediminicola ganghwensis TaxID=2569540 RepID=UPI0010AD25D5|nr:IS110 family transposase [Desulfosediminicola ganghwensis]
MDQQIFIGIDVSKTKLDIAVRPTKEKWSTANAPTEISALVKRFEELQPTLIVLESTGGLEIPLVSELAKKFLPIVVVNPRQVRDFAKATGKLAKTDSIDSEIIARFGEAIRPEPRPIKDEQARELDAVLVRRRQIVDMLTMEKNRLRCSTKHVRKDLEAHIKWLEKRLQNVDGDLQKLIQQSDVWRVNDKILQSVPGVGPVLSLALLAGLPELGQLNRKEVAALAGVAPLNRDSGFFRGSRRIWGGRAQIRSVLYMGALTAARCNPVIRTFHEQLIARGKKPKVALTACMRKLLTILNVMVRNQTTWSPTYAEQR